MEKAKKKYEKRNLTAPAKFWEDFDKEAEAYNLTRSGFIRFLFNFFDRLTETLRDKGVSPYHPDPFFLLSKEEKVKLFLKKARKRGNSKKIVFKALFLYLGEVPSLPVKEWIYHIMKVKDCSKQTARESWNYFLAQNWFTTVSPNHIQYTLSSKGKEILYGDSSE